jgi:hypothetical protein
MALNTITLTLNFLFIMNNQKIDAGSGEPLVSLLATSN